jgi:hypothetical protein
MFSGELTAVRSGYAATADGAAVRTFRAGWGDCFIAPRFGLFLQKSVFARVAEVSQLNINLNGTPIGAAVSSTVPSQRVYKVGFSSTDVGGCHLVFVVFAPWGARVALIVLMFASLWSVGHADDQFTFPCGRETAGDRQPHGSVGKQNPITPWIATVSLCPSFVLCSEHWTASN